LKRRTKEKESTPGRVGEDVPTKPWGGGVVTEKEKIQGSKKGWGSRDPWGPDLARWKKVPKARQRILREERGRSEQWGHQKQQ